MSRDYKAKPRAQGGRRSGSSLLVGILIGLVLGLVVALGVAWYINKMPSPFTPRTNPPTPPAKFESSKSLPPQTAKADEKAPAAKGEEKPRFDFYKILPGSEDAAPEKSAKDTTK